MLVSFNTFWVNWPMLVEVKVWRREVSTGILDGASLTDILNK
jgi:hypothetical protein